MSRIAFVISMYDELDTVRRTIGSLRDVGPIVVVQSDPHRADLLLSPDAEIQWLLMPDLAPSVEAYEAVRSTGSPSDIPARALCRNFSAGMARVSSEDIDFVVTILGDVYVSSLTGIKKIVERMQAGGFSVAGTRALGQVFFDANGLLTREQGTETTDIMPQFFVLDAALLAQGYFTSLQVTNRFTTEQCLGDEVLRYCGEHGLGFADCCLWLANMPYPHDIAGITYNPDKAEPRGIRRLVRWARRHVLPARLPTLPAHTVSRES